MSGAERMPWTGFPGVRAAGVPASEYHVSTGPRISECPHWHQPPLSVTSQAADASKTGASPPNTQTLWPFPQTLLHHSPKLHRTVKPNKTVACPRSAFSHLSSSLIPPLPCTTCWSCSQWTDQRLDPQECQCAHWFKTLAYISKWGWSHLWIHFQSNVT